MGKIKIKSRNLFKNIMIKSLAICSCLLLFSQAFLMLSVGKSVNKNELYHTSVISKNSTVKTSDNQKSLPDKKIINLSEGQTHYSIFINEPTFTFVYNNSFYFIDNYDDKLKCYNTMTNEFISDYIELDSLGNIVDAVICNNSIFILSEKYGICYVSKINLDSTTKKIEKIKQNEIDFSINSSFSKISVNIIESDFYVSLTPKNSGGTNSSNPVILVTDITTNIIKNQITLVLGNTDNDVKTSLIKIFMAYSNETTDYINMIFVCNGGVYGLNIPTTYFAEKTEILLDDRCSFYKTIDSSLFNTEVYQSVKVSNVSLTEKNNKKFIFLTFETVSKTGIVSSYTKIYEIEIALAIGSIFQLKLNYSVPTNGYTMLSNTIVSYPSNQELCMFEIDFSNEDDMKTGALTTISNPNLSISYLNDSDFQYVKANKQTNLLASPWNSTGIISINKDANLIIIGSGYIETPNHAIEDFKYCLYSINNRNYLGYVKLEDISQKETVPVAEEYQDGCNVIRGTALYSLPTKILGEKITNSLTSSIISSISETTNVEILDMLCGYTANSSKFLKVKVGETIGYIEENQIQNSNDLTVFIINNATIKMDNAKIYIEQSKSSEVLATLNKGDRIKVVEARNKKTGFCKIEYSDELGNIITGYVDADYIKNDTWSVMQIVGGILIAVNLGILILIVHFLIKRMEKNANKPENDNYSKSDYDSQSITVGTDF